MIEEPAIPGERLDDAPQGLQERLLRDLAGVLAEQKTRASQGDLQSVQRLAGKSDELLRELSATGALSPQSQRQLEGIIRAHRQVELILAAARQEASERLARLRRGRGALRGYGRP
jgi:hypothetical protein